MDICKIMTKYILVSGGVVSGIGKGVIGEHQRSRQGFFHTDEIFIFFISREPTASSTGLLLRTTGLKVTAIKIDPYMNIDAGTMRPTEHGSLSSLHLFSVLCMCYRSLDLLCFPSLDAERPMTPTFLQERSMS